MSNSFPLLSERLSGSKRRLAQAERMRTLLLAFSDGKKNTRDFCKEQGIGVWQFHYWRKRLGFNFSKRRGQRRSENKSSMAKAINPFVRLEIEDSPKHQANGWDFELQLPNGILFRGTETLGLKGLACIRSWRL